MDEPVQAHEEFPILGRAYFMGGRASTSVKRVLAGQAVDAETIRRVSVACYEAEMNVVLHAHSGYISLDVFPSRVVLGIVDKGPGIDDIDLAMTPGWSSASEEARALGFGAGMGLPNIREQADEMRIESDVGEGVRLLLTFNRGGHGDD
jgi:serine/threonine-protein kinase RsbT